MTAKRSYEVGDILTGPVRGVTTERIEWYDSAMLSAATNELRQVGSNIHTDPEYAKSQGLEQVNADGMIMANWCSEMMVRAFGMDYVARGELRTKFIRQVLLGTLLHIKGRIRSVTPQPNGNVVYVVDIWSEDQNGLKLTEGDASVEVAA
jgi:3-hydroxybutyryl-CoA dehydratase